MTTLTKFALGEGIDLRQKSEYSTERRKLLSSCELSRLSVLAPYSRCSLSTKSTDTLSDRFQPWPTAKYDDMPRKRTPTFLYFLPSTVSVAGTSTSVW